MIGMCRVSRFVSRAVSRLCRGSVARLVTTLCVEAICNMSYDLAMSSGLGRVASVHEWIYDKARHSACACSALLFLFHSIYSIS